MPENPRNILESTLVKVAWFFEAPVEFIRDKIVTPNQKSYAWYHQKFRRVPTIDECFMDDPVCCFEAEAQYRRDRQVDTEILSILRQRFEDCMMYEAPDHHRKCRPLMNLVEEAQSNWFEKYGDLGGYHNVKACYMKQKHRLIWERRHGPVGTGMKTSDNGEETTVESEATTEE